MRIFGSLVFYAVALLLLSVGLMNLILAILLHRDGYGVALMLILPGALSMFFSMKLARRIQ